MPFRKPLDKCVCGGRVRLSVFPKGDVGEVIRKRPLAAVAL